MLPMVSKGNRDYSTRSFLNQGLQTTAVVSYTAGGTRVQSTMKNDLFWLAAALCGTLAAQQVAQHRLTAREMFYAADEQPAASAKPAERPASKKKSSSKTAQAKPSPHPAGQGGAASVEPAEARQDVVPAVARVSPPLALRYTVVKRVDDRMVEVAPDAVFHAGDRIQVDVSVNDSGYLYLINQGSSGTWRPMFPSAEIENGDNHVEKGRTYRMPPRRLYFDEQPGVEKLFIVFSRRPEPDLEKVIYSLRESGQPAPAPAAEPRSPKVLMVANMRPIDDAMVGRLRKVYARDLLIEKVDEEASAAGKPAEKAVYVASPDTGPDARLVADIQLTHR